MILREPKASELPKLCALWKEAFGDGDEFFDTFERTAFSTSRARVAAVGNDIAAALYFFDCECDGRPIAYLYAIYQGIDQPNSLEKLTGKTFEELDAEYAKFLQGVRDATNDKK